MAARYESWASSDAARRAKVATHGRDTLPELRVRSALHRRGYRFGVCQRPLPHLRRTADIVFPRLRLAVFVDGCFWHGCPTHHRPPRTNASYWDSKIGRNVTRDRDTDAQLAAAGWRVLRIWEHLPPEEAAMQVAQQVDRLRLRQSQTAR